MNKVRTITNTNSSGIDINNGFRGATGNTYTFTNLDIRNYPFGPFRFNTASYTSWTNSEIAQFLTQATFTNCTISAAGYAALNPLLQPYFTIT